MSRDRTQRHDSIRRFKGETVFDWASEPANERPSELAESTRYGALMPATRPSAYGGLEVRRPRPPRKRGGLGNAWVALVIVLALAAAAIGAFAQWRPQIEGLLSRVGAPFHG